MGGSAKADRSAGKRRAIMLAARRLFAESGYERASTEAIAGAAGVSTATLFRHFAGKQVLFEAILSQGVEQFANDFSESTNTEPARQLALLAQAYARLLSDPENAAIIRATLAAAPVFPALAASFHNRVKSVIAGRFHAAVAGLVAQGAIQTTDDPLIPGSQLMGMIEHVTLWRTMLCGGPAEQHLPQLVDAALESFWRSWRQASVS